MECPEKWRLFHSPTVDLESRNALLTDFFKYAYLNNIDVVCDIYRNIFQFGDIWEFGKILNNISTYVNNNSLLNGLWPMTKWICNFTKHIDISHNTNMWWIIITSRIKWATNTIIIKMRVSAKVVQLPFLPLGYVLNWFLVWYFSIRVHHFHPLGVCQYICISALADMLISPFFYLTIIFWSLFSRRLRKYGRGALM